jgi:hypothetical protein
MAVKAAKKKSARKARANEQPIEGHVHIEVDSAGNATVTITPPVDHFIKNLDTVIFTSNSDDSAIEYRGTSPFVDVPPNQPVKMGQRSRSFKCEISGRPHHFDCGQIVGRRLSKWLQTRGGDTPVGDSGPR